MSMLCLWFVTISWRALLPRAEEWSHGEEWLFPGIWAGALISQDSSHYWRYSGALGGCHFHCNWCKNCVVGFPGWWCLNTFRNFFRWDRASLWERLPDAARHASLRIALRGLRLQTKVVRDERVCFAGLPQICGCTLFCHTLCFILFNHTE